MTHEEAVANLERALVELGEALLRAVPGEVLRVLVAVDRGLARILGLQNTHHP